MSVNSRAAYSSSINSIHPFIIIKYINYLIKKIRKTITKSQVFVAYVDTRIFF